MGRAQEIRWWEEEKWTTKERREGETWKASKIANLLPKVQRMAEKKPH